eukprot:6708225-Prymnesium_polylepis.1
MAGASKWDTVHGQTLRAALLRCGETVDPPLMRIRGRNGRNGRNDCDNGGTNARALCIWRDADADSGGLWLMMRPEAVTGAAGAGARSVICRPRAHHRP